MTRTTGRTLLWQLGIALMAVQAIVAIGLGLYSASQIRRFQQEQTIRELARVTPLIADRLTPPLRAGDRDALSLETRATGAAAGIRITVTRTDGVVLADSDHDPLVMDNHRYRAEIDAAFTEGTGSATRFSNTLDTDMLYFALRVDLGADSAVVVRTAIPLTAVDARVAGVFRIIGPAAAVSLLLTLGAIFLVSRRFTATVGQLATGAARFASGDLRHRIERPRAQELATLADGLNDMAERLNEQLAQLRGGRAEQAAILGSMSAGVIALDLEQRVLSVNRSAERILDLDGPAARGRLLQEVAREPALHRFVERALATTGSARTELALTHGERIEAVSESLVDADQRPIGLLLLLEDVTELRRLETIRSDFAANVSHELRTPITNIKGYVETMQEIPLEDSVQNREFLAVIGRNASRLEAIIEDLLALARLEQAEAETELPRTDCILASIVQDAIEDELDVAAEKSITVRSEVDPGLRAIGVPQLIEQAIGNLLSNALKYSGRGTTVTITGRANADGTVEIAVADEGPGIPAQHLPRLFERFYRVDQARSRELGGTGLGLAIVKHIALALGGRAEVQSTVGRGSIFRIILPRR